MVRQYWVNRVIYFVGIEHVRTPMIVDMEVNLKARLNSGLQSWTAFDWSGPKPQGEMRR